MDGFREKKCAVQQFQVSPDGRYIAFGSADEPTLGQEKKEEDRNDARVWGDSKANARLRLYTIGTGEVRLLIRDKRHVASCTWSPDSKELLYLLCDRHDPEARFAKNDIFLTSILQSPSGVTSEHITSFEHAPATTSIWPLLSRREFFNLHSFGPHTLNGALAVYCHSLEQVSATCSDNHRFYAGETEDPFSLVNLFSGGEFAVVVASGMDTRVDIVCHYGLIFNLLKTTKREAVEEFDVKKIGDEYAMACIRSSSPNKEDPNIWVGRSSETERLVVSTKLSSHFTWVENSKFGNVETFEWKGQDGVALDGVAWFTRDVDPSNVGKPLPTILHIHGGPYDRETPRLYPFHLSWQPILAEQGYLVLSPNYRGSSGRGHTFARIAGPALSTFVWSDVDSMVDEAVRRGLADKSKLAIGGRSLGGYLTAWGVSQTKNKYRCGIMGAGLTNWGFRAMDSDLPDVGDDVGGAAPWTGTDVNLVGDPIKHVKDIETAVLVTHGESDARVPAGQGVGFHRGLPRMSKYPDRHSLVVYPREGHLFSERKHVEDMIRRVFAHYEAWLQ